MDILCPIPVVLIDIILTISLFLLAFLKVKKWEGKKKIIIEKISYMHIPIVTIMINI